jgi:ABC-type transport system substrate-binding protein
MTAAAAVAMGLVAAGCSSASDNTGTESGSVDTTPEGEVQLNYIKEQPAQPTEGGLLAFGLNAETDGWNTASARWSGSAYIVGNTIFDPMAVYGTDGKPIPYLAQSFEPNEDFTVWTITLREGPMFHDGTPVNADAVVKNLDTHMESILTKPAMALVEDIRAVDNLTVEVTMTDPWSTFPLLLVAQPGYMMAPSMIDAEDGSRKPVGSGPFTFESWVPGANLKVRKNTEYWREGLPHLDNIEFTVFADVQTRGRALENGEIDVIETGDARQIMKFAALARDGKFQMMSDENSEQAETFIALNTTKPPFDDPLARQILAYGTDTQGLSDAAYDGIFEPARGMFSEDSPYYVETDYPTYDLEKAKALHEEYKAKYGRPLSFTANITPTPEIQNIAQTLQQQASLAGVEVKLNAIDQVTLISDAVSRNYEATGFILFGAPDPEREYVFLADDPTDSFLNITGNKNQTIIDAVAAGRTSGDPAKQREAWAIVQQEQAKDLNFIWLVHNLAAIVFDNAVYGLADATSPDGTPILRTLTPFLTETFMSQE